MAAISKMTANRRMITRTLTSSVETQCAELSVRLHILFFQGIPPDPFTLDSILSAAITLLQDDYDRLAETDQHVATKKGMEKQKRALRDKTAARVRQRLYSTRSLLEGYFPPDAIEATGLSGRTPEAVDALITHARNVQKQLGEGIYNYETLLGLERPNVHQMATRLGQDVDQLEAAVDELDFSVRETQQAQLAHNQAGDTWASHYAPVARLLESLYRLADMDPHADRLRPTARRRAGLPESIDLQEPSTQDSIAAAHIISSHLNSGGSAHPTMQDNPA